MIEEEDQHDEETDSPRAPGRGATVIACSPGMTGKQRRHLRGLGHGLSAIVSVGQHGLTDSLAKQLELQIGAHELIKVRVQEGSPATPIEVATWIHATVGAAVPQILGRTILVYRRDEKNPRIRLPDAKG